MDSHIAPNRWLSYRHVAVRYLLEPNSTVHCLTWMMCSKVSLVSNKFCPFLMIKSLRILIVVMVAMVILFTLSTGITYRMGVHQILNQTLNRTLLIWPRHKDLVSALPFPEVKFNQTLLSYAAVEPGEAEERQKINRLLEIPYNQGRMRSVPPWRLEYRAPQGRMVRGRHSERIPIEIFRPRYSEYWPEFRRSLQVWVRNKRFQPQVMRQLQDLVKTPLDRHYNATGMLDVRAGRPYRSCAVVGNSGILLQKNHGSLIDSHEIVIRLNNARTAGFSKNVGSKTTLAFVNSNILHSCARRAGCFCHPYGEEVPIILYICQAVHFMDFALCNASHRAPLLVTDARFDSLCARIVKYYSLKNFVEMTGRHPEEWSSVHDGTVFHYSSGMQAVMLAVGICEKVSIFGFGKSSQAKHHYHTNQKGELNLHDYAAEYLLYDDLANSSQHIPFLSEAGIKIPPVQIYL